MFRDDGVPRALPRRAARRSPLQALVFGGRLARARSADARGVRRGERMRPSNRATPRAPRRSPASLR